MATRNDKHGESLQRLFYPSFDGGLNLSVPNESLARNELKEAINVEFSPSRGFLQVRGGLVWSGRFDYSIEDVVPVVGRSGFLARRKDTKQLFYYKWNNIWPVLGTLNGNEPMSIAAWGDDEFLVASGGKLQLFSDVGLPKIETLGNSPNNCKFVFVRNGRAGVVNGDDTITFSYVGDCTLWDNDPDDESTGQFIEVGYKDGMNINAIVPLSRDLIVFKSPMKEPDKGTIWRLTGDFPNWQVLEAAHNTGTFSQRSVASVGNDVFFISPAGIASLSNVTSYGEVKTGWPDRKVANSLTNLLTTTAQLWDIPVKQQLWIKPSYDSNEIWIFDYSRGIWTKFRFPKVPVSVTGVKNKVYLFIGRDLYAMTDGFFYDDLRDEGKQEIEGYLKLGTILTGRQTLIKGAYASFEIFPQCQAELWLGKFHMTFRNDGKVEYIYDSPNDTQYASEDNDPLFPDGGVLTSRRHCIVRDWAITPEIKIKGGGCAISTMGLEIVEV